VTNDMLALTHDAFDANDNVSLSIFAFTCSYCIVGGFRFLYEVLLKPSLTLIFVVLIISSYLTI